jgi:hypothetical protein
MAKKMDAFGFERNKDAIERCAKDARLAGEGDMGRNIIRAHKG